MNSVEQVLLIDSCIHSGCRICHDDVANGIKKKVEVSIEDKERYA